ncbi:MAG: IPT/TIG domain-containing protein [Cyclobacteriaceae bacterium]
MNKYFCLSLFIATCLISCKSDEPAPSPATPPTTPEVKSSEKKILSFSFRSITPSVFGTINETNKTISVTVPKIAINALAPNITVSEHAFVLPASGTVQDFTNPVQYEVTAPDGSKQNYMVTVALDSTISLNLLSSTTFEQGDYVLITGDDFGTDASRIIVTFINTGTTTTTDITTFVVFDDTAIGFLIPEDLLPGNYMIKLTIYGFEYTLNQTLTVSVPTPEIQSIDKSTVERGQNLIITGEYFAESGNIVKLNKTGSSKTLTIVSESSTSIEVTVPIDTEAGNYSLSVTSNDKTGNSISTITVTAPSTTPVITSLDKFSYARGETITITGQNLKKEGAFTNINFIPFISGATVVRTAIPNGDGTELTYTIPGDFPTGSYIIVVEVDFDYSEEYGDVIQITL